MSNVLTTVLLISLMIVIIGVILLWNKNIFFNISLRETEKKLCSALDFTAADFCYEEQDVRSIATGFTQSSTHIKFNIRNDANNEIENFLLSIQDGNGNSRISSILFNNQLSAYERGTLISDFISDTENINQIKFIPQIKSNKIFSCEDKSITINWENMKEC